MKKCIKLQAVNDSYLNFIYEIETDLSEKHLWSDQRNAPLSHSFADEFHDRLANYYFNYFVITDLNGKPLGFVYTTQYHPWDHHLYMTIYVEKSARKSFAAAQAGILAIDYLFKFFDLKKIYTMVYDYNFDSLRFQKHGGFVEEGLLKQHRYYNGEYHDVHLLAMYPEVFYKKFGKVIEELKVDSASDSIV